MSKPSPQTPQPIQAVVVSRPGVMQQSLRTMLAAHPWLSVVASAGDGLTALNHVTQYRPELLVIDSNLLEEEVEALLATVKAKVPETRCLVLTRPSQRAERLRAVGADRVILRNSSTQELREALLQLM